MNTQPSRPQIRRAAPVNRKTRQSAAPAQASALVIRVLVCALLVGLAAYGLSGAGRQRVNDEALDAGSMAYSGTLSNGKFAGDGVLTFDNGDQYVGGFDGGRYDGRGTFVSADGWSYQGTFSGGHIVGDGMLQSAAGTIATSAEDE